MIFQPLTTIIGGTEGQIIQPQQRWLDVGKARRIVLVTEVFNVTGTASLEIGTAEAPTAEWFEFGFISGSGDIGTTLVSVLSRGVPLSQSYQLRQLVRWTVYPNGVGNEVTFRIRYTLN